jgi:hypothetical protein
VAASPEANGQLEVETVAFFPRCRSADRREETAAPGANPSHFRLSLGEMTPGAMKVRSRRRWTPPARCWPRRSRRRSRARSSVCPPPPSPPAQVAFLLLAVLATARLARAGEWSAHARARIPNGLL